MALPAEDQRVRLDALLVARGIFDTRSRARDAIARGTVRIEGMVAAKPGQPVARDIRVDVDDPARAYVSRAALKLIAGLDRFGFDPAGLDAVDLGASSGGFTQVLLERGARHVTAVDVGHRQMVETLRTHPRVRVLEGVNARDLTAAELAGREPAFIVCDVSFISLRLALPAALDLAIAGARALVLVKPQFEVGREAIGKGGLVRDRDLAARVGEEIGTWLDSRPGWRVVGMVPSPITGVGGNGEYLLAAVRDR